MESRPRSRNLWGHRCSDIMRFTHSWKHIGVVWFLPTRLNLCKRYFSIPSWEYVTYQQLDIRPKLYFVKVDVQACFDTIEQSKLLHILRNVLSGVCRPSVSWVWCYSNIPQDNYVLPRFGQVMQAAGKVKRKFAMKALPDGWLFWFDLATTLCWLDVALSRRTPAFLAICNWTGGNAAAHDFCRPSRIPIFFKDRGPWTPRGAYQGEYCEGKSLTMVGIVNRSCRGRK